MAIKDLKIDELVEDFGLYPRHHVDGSHVGDLARVIEAGNTLPLPIADEKSKRIIDGFHRVRAYRKAGKKQIKVDLRTFPDEAAMIKMAVDLNATHGRKLDSRDKTRSVLLLESAGVSTSDIAVVLHTTEDRIKELRVRVVNVNGQPEPAKPAYWPKKDEGPMTMTQQQAEVARAAPGWRHLQQIRHLTADLNTGLVDLEDDRIVVALNDLYDAIEKVLPDDEDSA